MKLISLAEEAKKLISILREDKEEIKLPKVDYGKVNELIDFGHPSFASVLPYRYFWSEKKLFINEHSMGFGLELTVFNGADEKLVNSIADLLRYRISDEMDLQFILWGSNQVGNIIDHAYQHQTTNTGIYSELAKASTKYYKKSATVGFKNKLNLPVALREYRLFAFLSKAAAYNEQALAEMESARDNFIVELDSMGVKYLELTQELFLSLLHTWINPNTKNITPYVVKPENYSTINEQVVDKSFELINEPERLTIEINYAEKIQTKITNLSIRGLPNEFALWESPDNFFNMFRASQAIRCPFLISMHMRLMSQVKAKNLAQSRYLDLERKARSVYAKYIPGTPDAAAEWKKLRDDLASDTIRLAHVYFNLMLFSNPGEEKKDESAAISSYRCNGIELFSAKYMQLQSFLATLPFLMSEGIFKDLDRAGRLKKLSTWNLANLLPLVADFKMCRQGVLLSSFRNQICFFDMYSDLLPTANYNIAVAATSGAGKSFVTIQHLPANTAIYFS